MTTLWQRLRRSRLWNRLRRLVHEPRIRLPAPGLRPEALLPGDRLQVGSRLWRVEARRPADPAAAFELTAADGPPDRAALRCSTGHWTFAAESGGRRAIDLDPAAVIHFPVAVPPGP